MRFLLEFKSFYNIGDIVLIQYWYDDMILPVVITEKISKRKVKITHNINKILESTTDTKLFEKYEKHKHLFKIFNAPDEEINISDIIQIYD